MVGKTKKFLIFSLLIFVSFISGCNSSPGAYRQKPFSRQEKTHTIRELPGSFGKIDFYDCNLDGMEEMVLVGEKEMLFFLATEDGWEEKPFFHIQVKEKIQYLDFTHCPGQDSLWLVLLLETQILFFPNMEKMPPVLVDSIIQDKWEWQRNTPWEGDFFQFLDKDMTPDLVIPFRSNFSWYVSLYSFQEKGFEKRGTLELQSPELFLSPKLAILQDKKTEILFQHKNTLKIYSHDDAGYFHKKPQKILDLGSKSIFLTEIAQLNQKGQQDFIFQEAMPLRLWVCMDRKEFYALPIDALSLLFYTTQDYNQDGWLDIVCFCMTNPNPAALLWHYLSTGYLLIGLDILYFQNQKGMFSLAKKERIFFSLPYPPIDSGIKSYWGDLNKDSFIDAIQIRGQRILVFYDVAGFLFSEPTVSHPFLSSAIAPFLSLGISSAKEDDSWELPALPEKYIFHQAKILCNKGKKSYIVLHYRDIQKEKDLLIGVTQVFLTY